MSVTKEFTVLLEDQPRALGKVSRALADRGVNAFACSQMFTFARTVGHFHYQRS